MVECVSLVMLLGTVLVVGLLYSMSLDQMFVHCGMYRCCSQRACISCRKSCTPCHWIRCLLIVECRCCSQRGCCRYICRICIDACNYVICIDNEVNWCCTYIYIPVIMTYRCSILESMVDNWLLEISEGIELLLTHELTSSIWIREEPLA